MLISTEMGTCFTALSDHRDLQSSAFDMIHASLSKSTWGKYASGWTAFSKYEKHLGKTFAWPLSRDSIRGFAVFCLSEKKLQPASVRSYISALGALHRLKGYSTKLFDDDIINMLLRGAAHLALSSGNPPHNPRRAMNLPLLRHFGHRLRTSGWSAPTMQCIWTAGLLAFFGTIRMGDLLSPTENYSDPTATLTWADILYRDDDDSFLIRLKIPKVVTMDGEFVDIFPFAHHGCCPVAALKKLKSQQVAAGRGKKSDPVFIYPSGKRLTKEGFNSILKQLMGDICDYKISGIYCHSFRAGIPSELSRHPQLTSSDDIKGWGRWSSEAYDRYTRLKLDQKKAIYKKITSILA